MLLEHDRIVAKQKLAAIEEMLELYPFDRELLQTYALFSIAVAIADVADNVDEIRNRMP